MKKPGQRENDAMHNNDSDSALELNLLTPGSLSLMVAFWGCMSYSQFSSVAQSCPTRCNPMNCSMPGLPLHHQLPEFTQTHVHRVGDAIQHPLSSPSPPAPNASQHQSFPMSQLFTQGSQSIGVSASVSVLPKNTPGLISFRMDWLDLLAVQGSLKSILQHTVQKHQFFSTLLSSQSNSHIHTRPLEKP